MLTPVTTPFDTVATALLFEDQVTFLFVASGGSTAAVRVSLEPMGIESVGLLSDTLVARIVAGPVHRAYTIIDAATAVFASKRALAAVYHPSKV
jgi:hypothetical protein